MKPKLFIVGLGIRFPGHLTFEAWEALHKAERIYTLLTPSQVQKLPRTLADRTESVRPLYQNDRPRQQNYALVINRVFEATSVASPVAWLTWGHPRVLDSVSSELLRRARSEGILVETYVGISSIDSVIVDVNYDPVDGLLVIECTTAVLRQVSIDPQIAVLLMQPGTFATHYPKLEPDDVPVDLRQLRDYLAQIYGAEHEVCFVSSSDDEHFTPTIVRIQVGRLDSVEPALLRKSSLFVPPKWQEQVVLQTALLRQMQQELQE